MVVIVVVVVDVVVVVVVVVAACCPSGSFVRIFQCPSISKTVQTRLFRTGEFSPTFFSKHFYSLWGSWIPLVLHACESSNKGSMETSHLYMLVGFLEVSSVESNKLTLIF